MLLWCLLTGSRIPYRQVNRSWLSRKVRNKLARTLHGNTVQHTRWESAAEHRGLELAHVNELQLPPNQAAIILKSFEVRRRAIGIAFANAAFLESKLSVCGGKFLVLITPGRLTSSLTIMLKAARPDLPSKSSEAILTLRDPQRGNRFPRQCVLNNLGEEVVKPAQLEPMVQTPTDESMIVLARAYFNKAPDEWQEACANARSAKLRVTKKVAEILKTRLENLETWGFFSASVFQLVRPKSFTTPRTV